MQIKFLRGNTAQNDAYTGPLGTITIDTQAKRIRLHDGATAGGLAQLANLDDILGLQTQLNSLGISNIAGLQAALDALQGEIDAEETARANADTALDGRLTTVEGSYIHKDGSVAFTAAQSMGGFALTNVLDPVAAQDAATKNYVDTEITAVETQIAALGNAFNYVGVLTGGVDEPSAFDLGTLVATDREAGDYYKVTTAGWFTYNAVAKYFNLGDGLVFNTNGSYDKIDNTNSEVQGTANYIAVTGSADSGFVVDVDAAFKTRVSDLETTVTSLQGSNLQNEVDATQAGAGLQADGSYVATGTANYIAAATSLNDADQKLDTALKGLADTVAGLDVGVSSVTGTAPIVVNNTDSANPVVSITNATQVADGAMSSTDKVKLDGIAAGAQVNTVDSVNGQTGAVALTKADVGLGNVENYVVATQAEVQLVTPTTVNDKYMTPLRTREFVEGGTYTIDLGVLP